MKKTMTLFIILSMLLGLVACETTVSDSSNSEVSSEVVVSNSSDSEVINETISTSDIGYDAVVTTGQSASYDLQGMVVEPSEGDSYYGQDAIYDSGVDFSFTDNQDGTITDNNTGLIWISIPEAEKFTYSEAVEYVENLEYAGYDDWRLPTPEELFSISDFSSGWPYIDTDYFLFNESADASNQDGSHRGGQTSVGENSEGQAPEGEDSERQAPAGENSERQAPEGEDSERQAPSQESDLDGSEKATGPSEMASKEGGQFWTSAISSVEDDERLQGIAFGVNHVTGHIKAYPMESVSMGKYVRAVRGDIYGAEDYTLNDDGTTTDIASGLMWTTFDLGVCVDWETALELAESSEFAGYTDWRLPDVKELQSIVDYSGSYPAINQDYFDCTVSEENENYYYWSSTSAYASTQAPDYQFAWYVAFGYTNHGAGAVRNLLKDPDSEAVSEDVEGDRDDTINFVRLVRTVD